MDPSSVTLDAATAKLLTAAKGHPVPLCDDAGNVIGYYLSPDRLASIDAERKAMYSSLATLVTEEELDAAERAGGSHSMDAVFKLLEKK